MTRRQLAMTAMTASMAKADSTDPWPDAKGLDPLDWTLQRYSEMPMRLRFQATTKKQAEDWQPKLRAKVTELIGGFPASPVPLEVEKLETKEFATYTRDRLLFTSRPGVRVAAWLLTPKTGKAPYPVMICVPGHGRGADDAVGVNEDGTNRTEPAGYQKDFPIQVAGKGMAALVIEPMAFGCRRDPKTKKTKSAGTAICQPTAGSALLFGETMIAWRVYDVKRAIDYVATDKRLDANRVGCMGISGGGTATLFATALEPRIKVAMISGYLNTFRDSIMSISHCIDNYVPGILQWAEQYDVAGLIAPRPLFAESGTRDPIFPIAASKESFARVKKVYDVFGASDQIEHEIFDGIHEFHGAKGIPFLARQLKA